MVVGKENKRSGKEPFAPLPLLLLLGACALPASAPRPSASPPPVQREFRGVWVATVDNIDWPSEPGLPPAWQRAELLAILDRAVELRLNAVILQVRPAADALYVSELEPWSEYLTGAMGRPPEPPYDPLRFAVDEAHRRGLELHAWFNPYRARHPSARSPVSADHVSRTRPELVVRYGRYLWMDPGEAAVQDLTTRVVLDVVRRYAVDGVHIDDYFYPYPERDSAGDTIPFPDDRSWARYTAAGGTLDRGDWRRHNVDTLIERVYREIKRAKPWVKFGISPFGYWRPGQPPGIGTTFDPYEAIYGDARLWIREGWADYFTPQLYWPIARPDLSYPLLLRWWAEQNRHERHLWPGVFTSRVVSAEPVPWRAGEITGQIYVTRGQPGAGGNVHFSDRAFALNPDSLVERLQAGPYAAPALIPASPWLGAGPPGRPRLDVERDAPGRASAVTAEPSGRILPTWWVVRTRRAAVWRSEILPAFGRGHRIEWSSPDSVPDAVAVTAVDRVGNEGATAIVEIGR